MGSSHRSRFITMGEGSFDQLPALLQQLFAVSASDSPPISIHRLLLFRFAFPVTLSAFRFRNIAPYFYPLQRHHCFPAVIALVRYYLRDSRDVNLRSGFFTASRSTSAATVCPASESVSWMVVVSP